MVSTSSNFISTTATAFSPTLRVVAEAGPLAAHPRGAGRGVVARTGDQRTLTDAVGLPLGSSVNSSNHPSSTSISSAVYSRSLSTQSCLGKRSPRILLMLPRLATAVRQRRLPVCSGGRPRRRSFAGTGALRDPRRLGRAGHRGLRVLPAAGEEVGVRRRTGRYPGRRRPGWSASQPV